MFKVSWCAFGTPTWGFLWEPPKDSDFVQAGTKEREATIDPTPLQVYQAIGKMYDTGYDSTGTREDELNGIVFAGYGDPFAPV